MQIMSSRPKFSRRTLALLMLVAISVVIGTLIYLEHVAIL
jgi:disulfide bond formation protein DsbB